MILARSLTPHRDDRDIVGLRRTGCVPLHGTDDAGNGLGRGPARLSCELFEETRVPEQVFRRVESLGDAVRE